MSRTEAQRAADATTAPAGQESAVDTKLEELLKSVDRTSRAAEETLEQAREAAADELTEKVEASEQATKAPDIASQLDSLLENVEPAKASDPPRADAEAASAPPADGPDLAGQLDALLEQAEQNQASAEPPVATTQPAANEATTESAAQTPPAEEAQTAATHEDITAALDALEGGPATSPRTAPDAEHMTEAQTPGTPAPAATAPAPAAESKVDSPPGGTTVPPNAIPAAPAEMTRIDADPPLTPPGAAPMLRVPPHRELEPVLETKPSLARRVGSAALWPLRKFHAGANAAEAATLHVLAPLGRPMASASRGVRMAVGGFALYSATLGFGAAYYAVFVRPTTFYETRAAAFSLKDGSLPSPTHGEEGSHAKAEGGHEKAASKEPESHGAAKTDSKAKSSKTAKKKPADKKPPAKKGAEKKAEGGGH